MIKRNLHTIVETYYGKRRLKYRHKFKEKVDLNINLEHGGKNKTISRSIKDEGNFDIYI